MAREVSRCRDADPVQLAFATAQGRVLLTRNRDDFVLPHDAWLYWSSIRTIDSAPQHAGILVLLHGPRNEDVAADVAAFLQRERSLANELSTLTGSVAWIPRSAYLWPSRRS